MNSPTGDATPRLAQELAALRHRVQADKTDLPNALRGTGDSLSDDTVSRIENGTNVRARSVSMYVKACERIAAHKKLPIDPAWFDRQYWQRLWKDGNAAPPFPTPRSELSNPSPVLVDNASASWTERLAPNWANAATVPYRASKGPVSKPVCEWSAEALRIHATVGGTRMVDYVLRPHDTAVRQAIDGALAGRASRMIILRGGSCTGKTRCAVEAVRNRLPDWSLVRPSGKDQLHQVLESDIAASTVILLDDIQELLGPGDGEDKVVPRLFEVATTSCAVLVIGTVWGDTESDEQLDLGVAVERLFDLNVEVIAVPSTFSVSQIDDARRILGPEFADVLDSAAASGELVQNLAGGPALVRSYEGAGTRLKAVLTAAIDLFRIGHALPIPDELLRKAAACYLSSRQQLRLRDDWFELAVREATTPVKRAVAALEPARTVIGGEALDGFMLADFLGYYGKRHLNEPPHEQLWGLVADQAVNRSAARAVALEARRRLLYPEAERLHRRTIELGWIGGWADLARLARDHHDLSFADELVAAAQADLGAAHGYPGYLWYEIAQLYYTVDDPTTAEVMLQNANDVFINWSVVAKLREEHGDGFGADEAARKDCEREGIPVTWHEHLIPRRAASGDFVGAERSAEAMAAAGFPYGWVEIGNALMFSYHDYRGAARAFQAAAERGYENSWQDVGRALALLGEYEAAEQTMLRTALSDVDEPQYAWAELAALRHELGDTQGAEAAAERGEGMGWARLATERAKDGEFDSAKIAAANAAGLGDGTGWAELAAEYERAGLQEEAEHAARNAAPFESGGLFGGQDGWRQIIRQRCEIGDWDGAKRACLQYRGIDEDYVQEVLVAIYEHSGQTEDVGRIVAQRAKPPSVLETVESLEGQGDTDDAEELAIHAAGIHGQVILWWHIAEFRKRRGDAATYCQLKHFGLHPDGTLREKAAARGPVNG
ncbi:tetratricopeptide repeat protein [Nocardia anaemiae]|uniref:tetratricopeptide repeat protein n=1 Tax=Nocardia anaemiae TaxID=263910 RepID=UPI0007A5312A|nr:hypothetical protein [Nocardia anaemiae]